MAIAEQCWHSIKASCPCPANALGWAEDWAGTQGGKRVIEYSVASCSATKTGAQEEREKRVAFKVAIAGRLAWHQSACRGGERLPLHPDSLLPFTQLSGSQPKSFSHFWSLYSLPCLTGGKCFCSARTGSCVGGGEALGILDSCVAHWACEL